MSAWFKTESLLVVECAHNLRAGACVANDVRAVSCVGVSQKFDWIVLESSVLFFPCLYIRTFQKGRHLAWPVWPCPFCVVFGGSKVTVHRGSVHTFPHTPKLPRDLRVQDRRKKQVDVRVIGSAYNMFNVVDLALSTTWVVHAERNHDLWQMYYLNLFLNKGHSSNFTKKNHVENVSGK